MSIADLEIDQSQGFTMSVDQAKILDLRAQLRRAMSAGDMVTAEEIAVRLAPFEDATVEELDKNPAAIVPMWGLEH